jgi:cytochrome c biogenesis protein CcdA
MKKILLSIFIISAFLTSVQPVMAQDGKIPISVFERKDCKHCQDEKAFLEELAKERTDLEITYHDIEDPVHKEHFYQITEVDNLPKVTPITLVGNTIIQGFDSAETTGIRIKEIIRNSENKATLNFTEYVAAGGQGKVESYEEGICTDVACPIEQSEAKDLVKLPIFGVINIKNYSLPVISLVLGFIDGFNPCAMWVLLMFVIILLETGSRKKMLQVAGLFIAAETIMYYLILNLWFTTWDFIGLDKMVTPIIGMISIGAGAYFLYDFHTNKNAECKVSSYEKRQKTRDKIKKIVTSPLTIASAIAILGIALSVNIIEFACSVGIPQAFTKILDINVLSELKKQMYMLLYIFMYMIDDFIIFGIAIYSFEKIGLTTKYARYSHLVGGILMLLLGYLLLFNPTALVFG